MYTLEKRFGLNFLIFITYPAVKLIYYYDFHSKHEFLFFNPHEIIIYRNFSLLLRTTHEKRKRYRNFNEKKRHGR